MDLWLIRGIFIAVVIIACYTLQPFGLAKFPAWAAGSAGLGVGEGERHVAADVDGALLLDHAAEQGGQLAQRVAIRAGRKDQASSRTPASSIGRLSSWPMVKPPGR